ncbi:MAG: FtsX-like permease family protein, partial [Bacillota bacterium]|nr:FtsX-like permease family protein [Bacillota bacterium]
MGIIVKFLWRNIREKKFRTFLIVFAITISAALFFATSAITGTLEQMYVEQMKKYYGNAEIMVVANEKSPSTFLRINGAEAHLEMLEYMVGVIDGTGYYRPSQTEVVRFTLRGISLEDLQMMSPIVLDQQYNLEPFAGKKIIISKLTAERYHLAIGDNIELELNGVRNRFIIAGISQPVGPFMEDGRTIYGIVPPDFLAGMYDARGKVTTIYLKAKDPQAINSIISKLAADYNRYEVRETITANELNELTQTFTTTFSLMLVLVLFISVFIIYSSFKVIAIERLPIIGTFRSIGATKRMTTYVMVGESMIYGVVGGLLGCMLGVGILYLMAMMTMPAWANMKAAVHFSAGQMVIAFLLALVLASASAYLPIKKISKLPVKDVVLQKIDVAPTKRRWRLYLGISLIPLIYIIPHFVPRSIALPLVSLNMFLAIIAVIMLIPYLTNGFVRVAEQFYDKAFGNEGLLAVKNLRGNQSILNNISLLAIGISSLLLINTLSFSVMTEVLNFYANSAGFQIMYYAPQMDRGVEQQIRSVPGVEETYGLYQGYRINLPEHNSRLGLLHGIDVNKFSEYWRVEYLDDEETLLRQLEEGRNILVSATLRDKFNLQVGDMFT